MSEQEREQKSPVEITIDLDDLDRPHLEDVKNLIYQEECDQWVRRIREDLDKNRLGTGSTCASDEIRYFRKQMTYYIAGGRGSGKSTFMRALINKLAPCDSESSGRSASATIKQLGLVDPTTLGSGENFFLYVLSLFYDKIMFSHPDSCFRKTEEQDCILQARHRLDELMEQLTVAVKKITNSNRAYLDTADDTWIYQDCMREGVNSNKIRERFRKLVRETCDLLHCDALILGIDDADVNSQKSAEVLEYLRKYMQSPRLIFLFAGDIALQGAMVRGMQLNHFHQSAFQHDADYNQTRIRLIDQMQEQYLLKLFPITNRYTLQNLDPATLRRMELSVKQESAQEEIKIKCYDLLQKSVSDYIGASPYYEEAIINMPKRSFFQLMRSWMIYPQSDEARAVESGLRQIASSALAQYDIKANEIDNESVLALSRAIIAAVQNDDDKVSAAALLPMHEDGRNRLLLYLSACVRRFSQKPAKGIELLLATFSYFQAYARFVEEYPDKNRSEVETLLKRYIQNCFTGDYILWGRVLTAIMAKFAPSGSQKTKQFRNGCIRIMKRGSGCRSLQTVENGILTLIRKNSNSDNVKIYFIAFKKAISGVYIGNPTLCISIYNILGFLQKCIIELSSLNDEKEYENKLSFIKPEETHIYTNSPFTTKSTDNQDTPNANDNETSEITDYKIDWKPVATAISKWWKKYGSKESRKNCCDAPKFSNCWVDFISKMTWRADEIKLTVPLPYNKKNSGSYHYVANTLDVYMKAFIEAVDTHLGSDYAEFIYQFPLWKALSPEAQEAESYKEARELVNSLYAGQQDQSKPTKPQDKEQPS